MGLLDEVTAAVAPRGSICSVAAVRAVLASEDATDLDDVIANPLIPASQIARALTNRGHKIAGGTIARHRKRECACG